MAYAMARIYAGSGSMSAEDLSALALRELAPQLAREAGLARYSTVAFADGRFGSFSVYENQAAAKRGQQIAADWVKGQGAMQGFRLAETLEGEIGYAVQGAAEGDGRLHGIARIYKTDATVSQLKEALEKEAGEVTRLYPGLARYAVAKLTDGRVGVFSAFDTQENARKSATQAKGLRGRGGSEMSRLLPSDPEVLEGTVIGTYRK